MPQNILELGALDRQVASFRSEQCPEMSGSVRIFLRNAQLRRVVRRESVVLFRFNVWNLREHTVELLATATRGPLADGAVCIQHGDFLSEGRRDELIERNVVVLRESLRAAAKRFGNVDVERSIAYPRRINVGSCMNPAASQRPTGRPVGVYPTGTAMLGYPLTAAGDVPKLNDGVMIASNPWLRNPSITSLPNP